MQASVFDGPQLRGIQVGEVVEGHRRAHPRYQETLFNHASFLLKKARTAPRASACEWQAWLCHHLDFASVSD